MINGGAEPLSAPSEEGGVRLRVKRSKALLLIGHPLLSPTSADPFPQG